MAEAPRLQRDGSTTARRQRQLGSGAAAVAAAQSAAAAHSATAAARWPQCGDDYLGMTIDYAFEGEVQIIMCQYLSKVIEDFPEEITGVSIQGERRWEETEQRTGGHIPSYSSVSQLCRYAECVHADLLFFFHLAEKIIRHGIF